LGEAEVWRDPLEQAEFVPRQPPRLTPDQRAAWGVIDAHLAPQGDPRPILLHGVTGSGKTELYLQAMQATLERGRQALLLVPEIALTPQTVRRVLARFPGRVGLVHSQLSDGERYDTWRRARLGQLDIVIGPRSALFTPLPDIGLIVLDESHDESYKEEGRAPRYHARTTAMAYADILGATCLFGSATPDLVTRYQAEQGQLRYLSLPQRILGHRQRIERQASRLGVASQYQPAGDEVETIALPPVRIVDMRQELKAGNLSLFSRPLQEKLGQVLSAGQQAILFLNRRGASTFVFCRDCGWAAHCPRCDRPLAHHPGQDLLRCHHCGYQRRSPAECPECGSSRVRHFGAGTQRVEQDLAALFPGAQTLRWDSDTTRQAGAHEVILAHFQARRAQVLIGTQMVAKGLDLPLVTLVGVISADTALYLPDFRASERTFQLLTQVAGRAGRGLLGGQVVLQTYQPDHYAIQAASTHDYATFYQQELAQRKALAYPPFMRLARLLYRHTSAEWAEAEAERLAAILRDRLTSVGLADYLIGPVPCFFERLRGDYRWQLVVRAPNPAEHLPPDLPEGWTLDIDPVSLL
jgi:primosomal protein N' (replication factor Y)